MFDKLFSFIRQGVRDAILGGIEDAHEELAARIGGRETLVIEATPQTNGRPRKAVVK